MFKEIKKESDTPLININEQEIVNKNRLNNILEMFLLREKKSVEILNSPALISDPSI
jgi:hypothetical protein